MELNKIIRGDCIEVMKQLDENSVDAIVTDPPYGLAFMGKEWDSFGEYKTKNQTKPEDYKSVGRVRYYRPDGTPVYWNKPTYVPKEFKFVGKNQDKKNELMENFFYVWAKECLRILKPGGYLLSFGGTRTYHRLVCGIEDAGFEIRDTIMWLYGSGFPKSLNIGKQIDKMQGNEREVVGKGKPMTSLGVMHDDDWESDNDYNTTKGTSHYEGWGTALKPACEPICVARKPLSEKNVALNVLKWGTGGINIDACRIDSNAMKWDKPKGGIWKSSEDNDAKLILNHQGRFPANIILDEEAGKMLDEQSGDLGQGHWSKTTTKGFGEFGGGNSIYEGVGEKDKSKHGASRFFYCAKASKAERNFGLDGFEGKLISIQQPHNSKDLEERYNMTSKNNHPTVKPIKLMEYLIKLVSKPGATIVDPFAGSGTTLIACAKQSRKFIGIEKELDYIKIAEARLKPFLEQKKLSEIPNITK